MSSRFDLAIGKIPKTAPKKERARPYQGIGFGDYTDIDLGAPPPRRNFLSQLKLVNEVTDAEIHLTGAEFNLSFAALAEGMNATININLTCPIEDARRLIEGIYPNDLHRSS
jgi:hypothetical protein